MGGAGGTVAGFYFLGAQGPVVANPGRRRLRALEAEAPSTEPPRQGEAPRLGLSGPLGGIDFLEALYKRMYVRTRV